MTDESDQTLSAARRTRCSTRRSGPRATTAPSRRTCTPIIDTIPQGRRASSRRRRRRRSDRLGAADADWLDGRNASSFSGLTWVGNNTLTFTVNANAAARNLQAMVPYYAGVGPIASITRSGAPVALHHGTSSRALCYAFIAATSGAYQVTYAADTTPPTISGLTAATTATTATVTWATDEAATSRIDYGTSAGVADGFCGGFGSGQRALADDHWPDAGDAVLLSG